MIFRVSKRNLNLGMRTNYLLKLAVIPVCFFLLWSCSKDGDPDVLPEVEESKSLLSVSLAPNYFPDDPDVEYSGAVYLTNEEGEVISSGELKNASTTELQEVYDLTTQKLNLSFVKKIVHPGGTSFRISTYTDVDPYEFSFENPLVKAWLDKATVQILNTGSRLEHFIYNYPSYSGNTSENEATFDIRLRQDPDHLFFTVKKETEDFRRYFLKKNVSPGAEISVDFQDLPPITRDLTIDLPENNSFSAFIGGAESTAPNNFYAGIAEVRARDGRSSHTFAIPEDLFENYKLRMILERDQKQYTLDEKTNSIKESYGFPEWDLQSSSAGTEYSFTSTTPADYYKAVFHYVPSDQPYDIVWTVTGRKTNEMNFSLPELQEFIAEDIPNFSLEELSLKSGALIRLEGISNYKDFIMAQEDNFSSEKETITKSENLISKF